MSFRRMTRMISFRVSEDEFELLRSKSEAVGARSVSDYARVALCGFSGGAEGHIGTDLLHLTDGIQKLRGEIRRLSDLLESPNGSYSEERAVAASHKGEVGSA